MTGKSFSKASYECLSYHGVCSTDTVLISRGFVFTVLDGGQNMTLIGCATKSLCGDYQALLNMLINATVSNDAQISCCEDDLCNGVKITTAATATGTAANPTSPNRLLFLVALWMLASCC